MYGTIQMMCIMQIIIILERQSYGKKQDFDFDIYGDDRGRGIACPFF